MLDSLHISTVTDIDGKRFVAHWPTVRVTYTNGQQDEARFVGDHLPTAVVLAKGRTISGMSIRTRSVTGSYELCKAQLSDSAAAFDMSSVTPYEGD